MYEYDYALDMINGNVHYIMSKNNFSRDTLNRLCADVEGDHIVVFTHQFPREDGWRGCLTLVQRNGSILARNTAGVFADRAVAFAMALRNADTWRDELTATRTDTSRAANGRE